MKTQNTIISVLILLLAVISVTAAYFLFEKRSELNAGWNEMSAAINKSSTELDKNSGTSGAAELSLEKLAISEIDSLGTTLNKFVDQSGKVIKSRDKLANILVGVARQLNVSVDETALRQINSYEAAINRISEEFIRMIGRRDRNFKRLIQLASDQFGVRLDPKALASGDAKALTPLTDAIAATTLRNHTNQDNLVQVNTLIGGEEVSFGSDRVAKASASRVADAASRLKTADTKLRSDYQDLKRENAALRAAITGNDKSAAELDKAIAAKKDEVDGVKNSLNIPAGEDPMPWRHGSEEVRRALFGKVVKVNNDYGYIGIDFGSETVVNQTLGKGVLKVNPQIAKGMTMVISRGDLGDKSSFIAEVVLDEVGATASTADIPQNTKQAIEVGDTVYVKL